MAEAIGLGASVIAVIQLTAQLTALSYKYISGVKHARDEIKSLVHEIKSLSIVFTNLEVCARDSSGSASLKELEDPLQKCAIDIQNFLKKLEPKGWFGKKAAPLVWPFKEKETSDFVLRMERHKCLFSLMLGTAEASRSKLIEANVQVIGTHVHDIVNGVKEMKVDVEYVKDGIRDVKDDAQEIKDNVQDVKNDIQDLMTDGERKFDDQKRVEALNWLYPGACNERHLEISSRRKEGTGLWIFEMPEMQDWIENTVPSSRLIWGHGIPGAGKTFLSSLVIDRLREKALSSQYGVAYIYFNYKEQDKQKSTDILANIVKQLACQIELPKEVEEGLNKLQKPHEKPSLENLYNILTLVIKSFTKTFIICDALDECNPRVRLELLPLFHRMGDEGVNLFLTSRDYPEDIQESFSKLTKIRLWARDGDIASYIKQKIKDCPRTRRLIEKGNYQEKVISEITKCACGMFLLVHFHIEHLCMQTSPRGFLQELEILRSSFKGSSPLNPIYDRAMEIVRAQSEGRVDLAFKILSWLVMAQRVLTVYELQMAVSMEEGKTDFNEQEDMPEITTLLEVCASLVTIDEKSQTIRLAHYTVQEYLEKNPTFAQDAKARVSISCITFVCLDTCISAAPARRNTYQMEDCVELFERYPFLGYAVEYLSYHVKDCDEALSVKSLLRLLQNPEAINFYYLIKSTCTFYRPPYRLRVGNLDQSRLGIKPPLHLAAYLGNVSACRILLEHSDVMSRDEGGNTPLHIASSRRHILVAKLFVEKGTNVNATDQWGQTALHLAVRNTKEPALVVLLLENGANVNATDQRGQTALHLTVKYEVSTREKAMVMGPEYENKSALVIPLLKNGANVNATDKWGQTALHLAIKNRNRPMKELLLKYGPMQTRNITSEKMH